MFFKYSTSRRKEGSTRFKMSNVVLSVRQFIELHAFDVTSSNISLTLYSSSEKSSKVNSLQDVCQMQAVSVLSYYKKYEMLSLYYYTCNNLLITVKHC